MKTLLQKILMPSTILLTAAFASAQELQIDASTYSQQIESLAAKSSCSAYSWKNRGRAPAGYVKGMALSFARSACRTHMSPVPVLARIMAAASSGDAHRDALAHYQSTFSAKNISTNVAGESSLRAIYTLGIGLGMRESSGAYCEGWDTSAGANRTSAEGEAGPFQTSYDSIGYSPELRRLYTEYQGNPSRCMMDVFKQGASCRARAVLGTGAGAQYQAFTKSCPAFAAEYAMTLLRLNRTHFGPINRREAEVNPSCEGLLKNVQALVDSNPEAVCNEVY